MATPQMTTPQRRLTAGALTAVLALALLAPAAAASADEPPVEDPTTMVLDAADVGEGERVPAEGPESAPVEELAEPPATLDEADADLVLADPAGSADAARPADETAASTAAPASLLASVTLAPGEIRTITAPVADAQRYSFIVLGDQVAGNLRTAGGQNYNIAAFGGYSAANVMVTSPETGEVTLSIQNAGPTSRVVPYAFAFVQVGSPLSYFVSGMGTSQISVDANPGAPGLTGEVRMIDIGGTSTTLPLTPITPGSSSYRATFGPLAVGRYLFEVGFDIGGVTHQRIVTAHAAAPETTPPYVEYTTVPAASNASGWFRRAVTASLAASDTGAGVWRLFVGLNSTPAAVYNPRTDVAITSEGVHTLAYYAEDYQNNVSAQVDRTIRIDLTAPDAALTGLVDGQRIEQGAAVAVEYSCSDALSGIADCSAPVASGDTLDTSALGTHSFTLVAVDRAGNDTRVTRSYTVFAPDTTAPLLEVDAPAVPASGWHTSPVTVRFLASDDESAIARIGWEYRNGTDVVAGSTPESSGELSFTATGSYELTVWAEDAAGNRSAVETFALRLDLDRPEIDLIAPIPGQLPGGHVAQHARVLVDFACTDHGSGIDTCDATTPAGELLPTGTPGTHEQRIVATDVAGNRTLRVLSYTVDATVTPTLRDPRLAQTGAEWILPGILLVAVLLAAGTMLLATRRLGGR